MIDAATVFREIGKRFTVAVGLWPHRRIVSLSLALYFLRRGYLPLPIAGGDATANPGTGGVAFRGSIISGVEHSHTKLEYAGVGGTDAEATVVADKAGNRLPVKGGSLEAAAITTATVTPAAGSVAAVLAASTPVKRVHLKSNSFNDASIPLWIAVPGSSAGIGYPLWPGDRLDLDVANLNLIGVSCQGAGQILYAVAEV